MRSAVAAVIVVALLAVPARAQCYRTTGCSYPVQTYQTPYYQPVYQAQVYQVPHYEAFSTSAIVGAAYPVYLPLLTSYTSLADDVRSYYSTRKATKDAYLEALREAAGEGLFSGMGTPAPPQPFVPPPGVERSAVPAPPPAVPNPPPPPAVPKAPGGTAAIQKLLTTRCASCHNPAKDVERVDLSIPADRITGDVRNLAVVWCADGSMPQKGDKLSQSEFDSLQAWAKAARPAVAKAIPPAQPADKK